ncbi:MAG: SIR2 family protein [Dehalococcoidia bacterium]
MPDILDDHNASEVLAVGGDCEFPYAVVDAAMRGNLVVFAGAGVSRDAGLPDFQGLVSDVHDLLAIPADVGDKSPDRQLGDLERAGHDVRSIVCSILGEIDAHPGGWHQAIVGLARGREFVRVVTTNYDDLLAQAAARAHGGRPTTFEAPALPLGRDFRGVVHLHGRLDEPSGIVATDADFSRAYLTDGWARRFLVDLFSTDDLVVLFVGYSHNDTIIDYLARGLPIGGAKRFALQPSTITDEDQLAWLQRAIKVISYSRQEGGSHANGKLALGALGTITTASHLGHEERVKQAAEAGLPALTAEERSYLTFVVHSRELVGKFRQHMPIDGWLDWIADTGVLGWIFRGRDPLLPGLLEIADWLSGRIGEAPTKVLHRLATLSRSEGSMNPDLWRRLVWHVSRLGHKGQLDGDVLAHWVAYLIATAPPSPRPLDELLRAFALPANTEPTLAVLDVALNVEFRPAPGISWLNPAEESLPHYELDLVGDEYQVRSFVEERLRPHLSDLAEDVLRIGTAKVVTATRRLRLGSGAAPGYDALNLRRSSIPPHEQNHGGGVQVLLDLLVEAAETVQASRDVARELAATDLVLLRRLAVHLVAIDPNRTSDEKLEFLLDEGLFDIGPGKYETFELIAAAFAEAGRDVTSRLWSHAVKTLSSDEDDTYELYNLAVWINRVDEMFDAAREYKAAAEEQHGWAPRDHLDFNIYLSSGRGVEESEPQPLLDTTPTDVVTQEQALRGAEPNEEYQGLLRRVAATIVADPQMAAGLAARLAEEEDWESPLWKVVAERLQAGFGANLWMEVLIAVSAHPSPGHLMWDIVHSLTERLEALDESSDVAWVREALGIVLDIWARNSVDDGDVAASEDVMHLALNRWEGMVGGLVVHAVNVLRQRDELMCKAALDPFIDVLEADPSGGQRLALANVFRNASFVMYHCPVEATRLLRLADWASSSAREAWSGLAFARWSTATAEAIAPFWDGTLTNWSELNPDVRRALANRLASVCLRADLTGTFGQPLELLTQWVAIAEDEAVTTFTHTLYASLGDAPAEVKSDLWDAWVRQYVLRRVEGLPRQLATGEGRALIGLVLGFPSRLGEVIEAMEQNLPADACREAVYYGLGEKLAEAEPDEAARLLLLLLRAETNDEYFDRDSAGKIAESLLDSASPSVLRQIADELSRLNFAQAIEFKRRVDEGPVGVG